MPGLLEEAAIDGIPAICIDPKGDLGNLLLTFPSLAASDFVPWVDPAEAARRGLTTEQFAAQAAETWKQGLAEWDQAPERIARFRDAVDSRDLHARAPAAASGLSVLRSLAGPGAESAGRCHARCASRSDRMVAALLALLGRDADPVKSRDYHPAGAHHRAELDERRQLDLMGLIAAIQKPGFDKLGAFDLETFYPAKERLELAMAVNSLLASPGFAAWTRGRAAGCAAPAVHAGGQAAHRHHFHRASVGCRAHVHRDAGAERTGGVDAPPERHLEPARAVLHGRDLRLFPADREPAIQAPMLTLLKQARAFGLGCVLATQNPIDLDYRGLGNTGTWLIGRLQTERDKLRVIEGLTSALGGDGARTAASSRS